MLMAFALGAMRRAMDSGEEATGASPARTRSDRSPCRNSRGVLMSRRRRGRRSQGIS